MSEMSNDELLEYFVQKVEETAVGFNVTLMLIDWLLLGTRCYKNYYDRLSRLFDRLLSLTEFLCLPTIELLYQAAVTSLPLTYLYVMA